MPLTTDSPQAAVSTRRDKMSLLRAAVATQPEIAVLGPNIITGNNQAVEALAERPYCAFRQLQNCGTTAVKYLVSKEGNCSANSFHGILAACVATDDGLGSVQQFGVTGDRVTIFSTGAFRVAVFEGIAPEGL